ncbi:LamG-like jellyroll fold domain-containing protein [Taibaiella soli]|uniref:PKD domain-containing protein n=1 Tax=Taibaiella soli TaxID=1649169 RepID=A0A2W2BE87_9BACT|nr:LamG-like jellyroll fold domain-containing protein [Taibaiella soli]PZF71906.1 hypothetical protein DN068_17790 [Taibaiella soli]
MGRFSTYCAMIMFLIISCFHVNAQQHQKSGNWNRFFEIPVSVPVPNWVKQIDWEHPNVYEIDSILEVYGKGGRDKEEEEEENELNEEPYKEAYIRWRKSVDPFIQADGSVVVDPLWYQKQFPAANATASNLAYKPNGTANWTILGPQEMWNSNNGGKTCYLANVYSMAIAPSSPNIIYAGTETGAIFKSSDKGLNWKSVSDALPNAAPNAIAVSPLDSNTVFAYTNAMLKTTNGGSTWSIMSNYTGGSCNQILINPVTGRIIAAGNTSIYYSDDTGAHWTLASGGTMSSSLYDIAFNPANPNTIYAVGRSSAPSYPIIIVLSHDGGNSFNPVTSGTAGIYCTGARLAVTAADSNYVYCVTLDTLAPKVLKSRDGGNNWFVTVSSTTTGLTGGSGTSGLAMSNGQGYYDLIALASPADTNTLIVGSTSAYRSTDGGYNFSPLGGYTGSFPLHPDMQWAMVNGNDAYISTDGGVNYSSDFFATRANHSIRNNGVTGSDFWGFGQGWDQDIVVGGRYHNGDVALYENYGTGAGLELGGGESATGFVFHGTANTVGFDDIGTKVIPNALSGGITGAAISNSLWPGNDYYGKFSQKLVVDPRYSNVIYITKDSTLWKSVNKGASYTAVHNFGNKAWRFVIARNNPAVMYLCATNGIFKTTDTGATWTQLALPGGVTYQYYNTDITVNPLNENEVYFCMAQGAAANKVFKSVNGGASWTNYTGSVSGKAIAFIIFQGGTNGGVYAITNSGGAKVYYRDNSMSDWIDFSSGLPQNFVAAQGGLIFYRDSKLRLAGNRGVWESALYSTGAPVAQPMSDKQIVSCTKDTVSFMDYSMDDYSNSACTWSFPGAYYTSCTNCRTPKVLYPGPGSYDVSLTVVDSQGNSNTRTINNMIVFDADKCMPDTVAGKSLKMNGSNTTVSLGKVNINSNTFSMSCWFRPYGNQSSFSQLLSHDKYGVSPNGFGIGFTFNGYTSNLKLCYTDSMVTWGNNSGLVADSTKWNFVVLTYSPTGVKMYLNGVAANVNTRSMPAIDLSQSPFYVNFDANQGQGSRYNGEIDEIKFYNYTLSQDEVRTKMHLIQNPALAETGLLKYVQFNQYDSVAGTVYDVAGGYNCTIPGSSFITTSTAPVATGVAYKLAGINAGGQYTFNGTGIDLFLKTGATYPNGDLVGFRLFSGPDQNPDARPIVPANNYFIISNYGSNSTFTAPDSIRFNNLNITSSAQNAGSFKMFKRSSTAYGPTWGAELDSADAFYYNPAGSSIVFSTNNNVSSFSQFVFVDNPALPPLSTHGTLMFNVVAQKKNINLDWSMQQEQGLNYYQLERSTDGIQFAAITQVTAAGSGHSYKYTDKNVIPGTRYYYRLRCVDMGGSYSFSTVMSAIINSQSNFMLYPNPASGSAQLLFTPENGEKYLSVTVYDISGKSVYHVVEMLEGKTPVKMLLNLGGLSAGNYVVHLATDIAELPGTKLVIH